MEFLFWEPVLGAFWVEMPFGGCFWLSPPSGGIRTRGRACSVQARGVWCGLLKCFQSSHLFQSADFFRFGDVFPLGSGWLGQRCGGGGGGAAVAARRWSVAAVGGVLVAVASF